MKKKFLLFVMSSLMLLALPSCNDDKMKDLDHNNGQNGIKNGHEYVDLGLPSGTLWATCNVGADNPEDYGDYFAWGETEPKSYYDWSTYKYGSDYNQLTKYCSDKDYGKNGYTDNKTELDPEDDAATANWGSDWRMPTTEEQEELVDECQWNWTTVNGKNGYRVTGPNGNAIFLPAAGYYAVYLPAAKGYLYGGGNDGHYWSSKLDEGDPDEAYYLYFCSDYFVDYYGLYRYRGASVRPVLKR